jgi:hypothetical protein
MTVRIKIEDWSTVANDESGFYLEVPTVPRVGEIVRLHHSVCGSQFLDDHKEHFSSADEIDGCADFTVRDVLHTYGLGTFGIIVNVEESQ